MRIISKHKDYYDYYQGIFGIDNNKIFRRGDVYKRIPLQSSHTKNYVFAINNKLYYLEEDKNGIKQYDPNEHRSFNWQYQFPTTTTINIEKRKPIVYGTLWGNRIIWKDEDPLMSSFEFYKIMDAKALYIEVETFLGFLVDHQEIPNNQSDIEKLVAHGFDKKNSFRNTK